MSKGATAEIVSFRSVPVVVPYCFGSAGASVVLASGPGWPTAPFQSVVVPSAKCWCAFHEIEAPDVGFVAVKGSSAISPSLISMVHVIAMIRPACRFSSCLAPAGAETAVISTSDGISRSTDTVDTLPSVGMRTRYYCVAPALDSRGDTVT